MAVIPASIVALNMSIVVDARTNVVFDKISI